MTFLIHKPMSTLRTILLVCGLASAIGCSTQQKVSYEPVNTRPIVGDDAIALRADWPKSVCYYQNGDVACYSTRYPYQASEIHTDSGHLILDNVTFIVETAFLPIELIANPPFQSQVSYGVKYPPTYTAQPPLPPVGGDPRLREKLYKPAPAANPY